MSPPASHNSRPHAARRRQLAVEEKPESWPRAATPSPAASHSVLDFASRDIVFPGQTKDLAKHDGDKHSIDYSVGRDHEFGFLGQMEKFMSNYNQRPEGYVGDKVRVAILDSGVPIEESILDDKGGSPRVLTNSRCRVECGCSAGQKFLSQSSGRTVQFPKNIRQVSELQSILFRFLASQTEALNQIHQSHDQDHHRHLHGDLKPENILWFSDRSGSALSKVDFRIDDFGNAPVDRRHISGSSRLPGPREVTAGKESHASGTFGSESSRLRSRAITFRSKQEWMDFVNKFHLSSRIFDASAKLSSVAEMPGTGDGRLPWEFVGYDSRDEVLLLEDTERWNEHISSQLLKKLANWFCDDPRPEVQRRDLNPVIKFRDRLDHVCGHIRNDDSSKGQTRPDFTSALRIWRMIADHSCPREGGTASLGRVDQIKLLSVLSGLESIWQDRLWVLQKKAMTSTFSRASEVLRGSQSDISAVKRELTERLRAVSP